MSPPAIRRIQDEHRLFLAEVDSAVMMDFRKKRKRCSIGSLGFVAQDLDLGSALHGRRDAGVLRGGEHYVTNNKYIAATQIPIFLSCCRQWPTEKRILSNLEARNHAAAIPDQEQSLPFPYATHTLSVGDYTCSVYFTRPSV